MSLLETYLKNVRTARGIHHQVALQGLRRYIKETPPDEIMRRLRPITDMDLLKTLWEAGLKEPVRTAVLNQIEDLQRRRK